jgi:hypothetical protein
MSGEVTPEVHDQYFDFRGVVDAWMRQTGADRERTIYYLRQCADEIQYGLDNNREWRLARLEAAMDRLCAAGVLSPVTKGTPHDR